MSESKRINLESPRYDQSTFEGRAKHFFITTNPMNVLASDADLENARTVVEAYRSGKEDKTLTEDQIWAAKELYDSAFHCQTGEKLFLPGRMSFQVPGNMFITGCMMTFYRSTPAVIFWQLANQSFNSLVNYTNRNASAGVTNEQLGTAYVAATTASVVTALGFNRMIASRPALAAGIVGRLVPLAAVAAANCVNIPLMRQQEIVKGITIETEDGRDAGLSSNAALAAIGQVIPSRIGMAVPGMMIPPIAMSFLEKSAAFIKNPWLKAPTTVMLTGACLTFSTPLCCALFPQKAAIQIAELEPVLVEVRGICVKGGVEEKPSHRMLRSYIVIDQVLGKEYFCENRSPTLELAKMVLTSVEIPDAEFESVWRRELAGAINVVSFPEQGPLWRLKNISTKDKKRSCWIFCFNHGIDDQQSTNIIVNELMDFSLSQAIAEGRSVRRDCEDEMKSDSALVTSNQASAKNLYPLPPSMEVACGQGITKSKLFAWALPHIFATPLREAPYVATKSINDYKANPSTHAHFKAGHERKTFIETFKMSREDTSKLVYVCRSHGVTVTSAISAVMLSLTSLFLQNGSKEGERSEPLLKTQNMKVFMPVCSRPYGKITRSKAPDPLDASLTDFEDHTVIMYNGAEGKRSTSTTRTCSTRSSCKSGMFDGKADWTRGAVVCAAGAVDFVLPVQASAVVDVRGVYNAVKKNIEISHTDKTVAFVARTGALWELAKDCRVIAKEKVEKSLAENLLFFEFLMRKIKLCDILNADSNNPLIMGRFAHCCVSNVGVGNLTNPGKVDTGQPLSEGEPQPLVLKDAYFGSGGAYFGFFVTAFCMTVEGCLTVTLTFIHPLISPEDAFLFKETLLTLLKQLTL